jgi:hypothetical protein
MIPRFLAVALLIAVAGCGGHKTDTTTTTTGTTAGGGAATAAPAPGSAAPALPGSAAGDVPTGSGNPPGYGTESAAQAHCPSDTVVWLNTNSRVFHEKGMVYYGRTKHGAYVCKKEALAAGDHETGNYK